MQIDQQRLNLDRHQFNLVIALLSIVILFVMGMTIYLVFVLKEVGLGLLVLSHAAALAIGYLIAPTARKG